MEHKIIIIGLGAGHAGQMTLETWECIQNAKQLFLRTADHPAVEFLKEREVQFTTFDSIYEQNETFEEVYEQISDQLIRIASQSSEPIIYAVPGHPMVAEATVQKLIKKVEAFKIRLDIIGGGSFLDPAFLRFGLDPIDGFQLLDATQIQTVEISVGEHLLIAQVYDRFVASDVKLTLMNMYPDDFEVVIGHALGVPGQEQIIRIPLYELDHHDGYGNLSLIWVPRTTDQALRQRTMYALHQIVAHLRGPDGCPWDQEQTHTSIRRNLIEETYEVLAAIDHDDVENMQEELGDLLLQIMLHSQMEEEVGTFSIYDVMATLHEKLIRRHPHVFGESLASNAENALLSWEAIKAKEKELQKGGDDPSATAQSILAGVPAAMPSLYRAEKLQKKAAKVGFDWQDWTGVWDQLKEEIAELKEAIQTENEASQFEELGDLLFTIVNLARSLSLDADHALNATNRKFIERFSYIEQQLRLKNQSLEQTSLIEMETLWQAAKRID